MNKQFLSVAFFIGAILLFFIPTNLFAQYAPKVKGELVKHQYYQLDYIEQYEQPAWVYYNITSNNVKGPVDRIGTFTKDPKVKTGSSSPADYTKSGYDRGHICPAADMKQNEVAMKETFYMSNMSPQTPALNRGVWNRIESHVRSIIKDSLYIVSGPIFKDLKGTIGAGKVTIPGYFFKVAYDPQRKTMLAYIIPNTMDVKGGLSDFVTTVDEIEELIGYDLFEALPDSLENKLEAQKSPYATKQ